MKEVKCIDAEQRDSLISAINAQGYAAKSRYDSERRCWYVCRVHVWEDFEDRRAKQEAKNAHQSAAS